MAVVDAKTRTITVKIVYYGCAMGGKTTNLVSLHRLTDPGNTNGLFTIATQDDRTLFFDLLPLNLGQIGGMNVKAKVYTVPGQVHYEVTRRQVLGGADGVVMVVDSSPECDQKNRWSMDNLRFNLRENGLPPDEIPLIVQWNKRDLPDARPVGELQRTLNSYEYPTVEAIATSGAGVVETFQAVLIGAIARSYLRIGRQKVTAEAVERVVAQALEQAKATAPQMAETPKTAFDQRFDMEKYRDQQAEHGRDRRIVDQESLLSEAVNTNMKLAERLDGFQEAQDLGERRSHMMESLSKIAPMLADPSQSALPPGVMGRLIEGSGRTQGSLLLFDAARKALVDREVIPEGPEPLNESVTEGLGSVAFRIAQADTLRVISDLRGEVFFDAVPPAAEGLAGVLIAPLQCDGLSFGALFVYSKMCEAGFDDAERDYWKAAATFIGLSLHWRALRRKVAQAMAS